MLSVRAVLAVTALLLVSPTQAPAWVSVITAYELPGSQDDRHRSEEHTSELQSPCNLVCRLLLEKKNRRPLSILVALGPGTRLHLGSRRRPSDLSHERRRLERASPDVRGRLQCGSGMVAPWILDRVRLPVPRGAVQAVLDHTGRAETPPNYHRSWD